jgi:hypothetical protein
MTDIYQYIVLRYHGSDTLNPGWRSIVVSRSCAEGKDAAGAKLEVHVPEQWDLAMLERDRDYVEGLVADWRSDILDRSDLFDQLSHLDAEPLRCIASGVCDSGELAELVKRFLA